MNKLPSYEQICVTHKDLVEAMAFVALQKMRKPSPYTFEDLCQEGYIVCVEWVQRWFHPERGASLKTFITAGLRNHFADLVRASFKDGASTLFVLSCESDDPEADERPYDLLPDTRSIDPLSMVNFNETIERFSEQEREYITTALAPITSAKGPKLPSRAEVRKILRISEEVEARIRSSIEGKLLEQVLKD